MLFNIKLEAYVGTLLSIFIIKAGFDLIKESIDNMVGVRIESNLSKSIKKEIIKEKNVQGAYDLLLNDYGPDKYLGSIHIEVADSLSVADVDKLSRKITKTTLKDIFCIQKTKIGRKIRKYKLNLRERKNTLNNFTKHI